MIELIQLQNEVRKLAKQYPDAIYRNIDCGCYYGLGRVENGPLTEGCLIGQAIRRLDTEVFLKIDNDGDDIVCIISNFSSDFDKFSDEGGQIENWLFDVQQEQDCRKTWSEAVRIADLQQ